MTTAEDHPTISSAEQRAHARRCVVKIYLVTDEYSGAAQRVWIPAGTTVAEFLAECRPPGNPADVVFSVNRSRCRPDHVLRHRDRLCVGSAIVQSCCFVG